MCSTKRDDAPVIAAIALLLLCVSLIFVVGAGGEGIWFNCIRVLRMESFSIKGGGGQCCRFALLSS